MQVSTILKGVHRDDHDFFSIFTNGVTYCGSLGPSTTVLAGTHSDKLNIEAPVTVISTRRGRERESTVITRFHRDMPAMLLFLC